MTKGAERRLWLWLLSLRISFLRWFLLTLRLGRFDIDETAIWRGRGRVTGRRFPRRKQALILAIRIAMTDALANCTHILIACSTDYLLLINVPQANNLTAAILDAEDTHVILLYLLCFSHISDPINKFCLVVVFKELKETTIFDLFCAIRIDTVNLIRYITEWAIDALFEDLNRTLDTSTAARDILESLTIIKCSGCWIIIVFRYFFHFFINGVS